MIKHVGKHNNKKVVILYRTVPGEDHMALVAYSDTLPRIAHDEIMRVLESPVGQQAENLADALFRNVGMDGRNSLEALHRDGLIKKIQTSQILVTPTTRSSVRLDELNKILAEMATGEAAVKRLSDLDRSRGLADPANHAQPTAITPPQVTVAPVAPTAEESMQAMTARAVEMRATAKKFVADAKALDEQVRLLQADNGKDAPNAT